MRKRLNCGFHGENECGRVSSFRIASLNNFRGVWGRGVSCLGRLEQGNSGTECKSLMEEVGGGVGSGFVSLHMKGT